MTRGDAKNVARIVAMLDAFKDHTGVRLLVSGAMADQLEALGIHDGFVRIEEMVARPTIELMVIDEASAISREEFFTPMWVGIDLGSKDETVFSVAMERHGERLEIPSDREPRSRFRRFDLQFGPHSTRPYRSKYLKSLVQK